MAETGKLYVVATPIGNMEDMTQRALRVLGEVGLIAAEDTRRTGRLLAHFGIKTRLTSYFEHNEARKAPEIVERLKKGGDVALVTDAGTPGISDPGYRLVRLAVEGSVEVVAIPGASALTAVLSVSGLPTDEFTFKGFLPPSQAKRRKALLELGERAGTYIIYESPKRLARMLGEIRELLGDVEVCIGREMTKLHEEVLRGRAGAVLERLEGRELKGEVTLVVRTEAGPPVSGEEVTERLRALLIAGVPISEAVKAVSKETRVARGTVYKEALRLKETIKGGQKR